MVYTVLSNLLHIKPPKQKKKTTGVLTWKGVPDWLLQRNNIKDFRYPTTGKENYHPEHFLPRLLWAEGTHSHPKSGCMGLKGSIIRGAIFYVYSLPQTS